MELTVTQVLSPLATRYRTNQISESRDQIGFWLSVLLLCLLPIEHWRFPFNLKPADLALVLLTLYGLLKAWRTHQRLDFPLLLPMWVILFSSLLATLVGFGSPESIIAIVQEIYLFSWFIVLTNILKTVPSSDTDRLMKIVIACLESVTTVMGMLRIGPSIFYRSSYEQVDMEIVRATGTYGPSIFYRSSYEQVDMEIVRATGTYDNSNAAAMYLSVSGSNGALLSTLGSLVVLAGVHAIIRNRQDARLWAAVIGIGVGMVAVVLFTLGLSTSLPSGFGLDTRDPLLFQTLGRLSHSVTSRLDILAWAWKTYSRHPWGTGPNSFASGLHNDYAAFWFERGPLGIIGWLWLIAATLLRPLQVANQLANKHRRWQVLVLGAGFLACAVNAFSHEISHMRQVWMLMALLFASSQNWIQ